MSDAWENLDPDDLEAEMERQEAYELSPAGIAEQNRYLLQRQQEFRLAADAVTAAWSERGEVEAVALFGSVAVALCKEVPRFRTYRRAGIALIPTVIDQNPCAHLRMPRDMIFHGWSMRLFQAWQHSATMSS